MFPLENPTGWRKSVLCFGEPRLDGGFVGLVSPDGQAWEIFNQDLTISKQMEKRIAQQIKVGYEYRRVCLDNEMFLVERYTHSQALKIWSGLKPLAETWDIDGPCPYQGTLPVEWVKPGGLETESLTLYLYWRSFGIDPEGVVWKGYIHRYDKQRDGWLACLTCPSSPNLLPTLAPRDAPPRPKGFLLFSAPMAEVGFLEDQEENAKQVLLEKASLWLRSHGTDPSSWERPVPKSKIEVSPSL